jgi:hypothetical protein
VAEIDVSMHPADIRNMKFFPLFVLCSLLMKTAGAASDGDLTQTAVGWVGSGGDLSGIPQQATDIWTAETSWGDLQNVGYPASNPNFTAYVKAHPDGVVDFGTGLVPTGLPSSEWNGMLDQVAAGAEDSVFVLQGQRMAKYGTNTVYCRPWWEMTQNVTNLDPAKFQAAWNHAIPIIKQAFAAAAPSKTLKIAYCYLPDAQGNPKTYFPGPQNVDVIDADIYGKVWGSTTLTQTALLAVVQNDLNYLAAFAAAENKPAGISEWGNFAVQTQGKVTSQGRGDDPEYIDLMLSFGAQHHFLYMVYFDIASGGVGQTFADTPSSLAHFRAALTTASAASTSTSTTATSTPTTTTSTPATTFSAWQARYFTPAQLADPTFSGPTSDPYGSEIPNLLAYALQLDPATAQVSDIPEPAPKDGHLIMSYRVPSGITDVSFVPEVSSDLQTWDSSSASVQVVSNDVDANGTMTITVEDCLPASMTKRYMRLRVTEEQ